MGDDKRKTSNGRGCLASLIMGVFVLSAVYVLSVGPMVWLVNHGFIDEKIGYPIYFPLTEFSIRVPTAGRLIVWYVDLWD